MNEPLAPYTATLDHIKLLADKRDRLAAAQLEAENQVLHRVAADFNAGKLSLADLCDFWDSFRKSALQGYSSRWKKAFPEFPPNRLSGHLKGFHRAHLYTPDEDGNWRGNYPFDADTDRRPKSGVSVVYVLYDIKNAPCYVGSTHNLGARLESHYRGGKRFTKWLAYACTDRAAAYALETRLLQENKPYLNKRARA
ncbi:GIY-YIG nuclease family protein [Nocardiopsis sp. NPDC101807]|uniref:GIY-YIG nuclease family protein n=1 Tax=Nocardiopsis sp. NPDC101807 TaxID=3364339 RepID=UPI00380AB19C